jgi:hypothetical protein
LPDQLRIADVSVDETQPLVSHHVGEVVHVAGIRQCVEGDHLAGRRAEQMAHHVRGDEPGTAGNEHTLWFQSSSFAIV